MIMEENYMECLLDAESMTGQEHLLQQTSVLEAGEAGGEKEATNLHHYSYLNQLLEESTLSPDKQSSRRIAENKIKHKKLKQKLNLLSEQILDQGLLKDQKDITSPNKSRLLKLAIELEKSIRTQAIDYQLIEPLLREIQKILEHRREHDILILRGARAISTFIALVKRFPSMHRTEAAQSMVSMQLGLRLLRIMLSVSSSRQVLLISNHVAALTTLLSCALMREQKKIAVSCLYLLNSVLVGPNRIQLSEIISANLEYILCSSLLKRLKAYLESCISEDDPGHSEFILLGFKFYYEVMRRCSQKELGRPVYGTPVMDNLSRALSSYFQPTIQLLTVSIVDLVLERQPQDDKYSLRDDQIPTFKINILLYIFKCLNIIFHVNITFAQKIIDCNSLFMRALNYIFNYVKENFKDTHQIKSLCNEIISFIGHLACENQTNQNLIRESGLLASLCNHPLEYIMDPLKHIFVPAFCLVIHQNRKNYQEAFRDNSVLTILKYIQKQICTSSQKKIEEQPSVQLGVPINSHCKILSRKTSVSSMNSTYSKTSMAESYSTQNSLTISSPPRQASLDYKFRPEYWEAMAAELRKIDD